MGNKLNKSVSYNKISGFRELPLLIVILVIGIILSFISPNFLNAQNIIAVLLGGSFDAIVAVSMTLLLISGGFDLSIGSVAGFGGVMAGKMLVYGQGPVVAVIVGILSGAFVGLVNGFIIAKIKVNPLITTLAMLSIVRGTIYIITKGLGIPTLPDNFNIIAQKKFYGFQTPIIIMIIFIILAEIFFRKSVFFKQYYFIGGNEESARLSGIRVDYLRILTYVISGTLAALSGILMASRMGGAISTAGTGMELRIITACVIGGCSLAGGEGTMLGSFLGVLLMVLVVNAFNLLGVSVYWQQAVMGTILLVAVLIDVLRRRRFEKQ
ncbi:MAG TPA: ABC transporter permease [Methanosarcinales archaeon]|nr:ABC transporter permease [Methanosarcinales archaeon]